MTTPALLRCLPCAALLVLTACQSTPTPSASASKPSATTAEPAAPVVAAKQLPPGVVLSAPQKGSLSVAFAQSAQAGLATFPKNRTGASLAFDSALRMPLLEAVDLGQNRFRYNMRFVNATKAPLTFSVVCFYGDSPKPIRSIAEIDLPTDTFRDLSIDFEGDITRKVGINARLVNKP